MRKLLILTYFLPLVALAQGTTAFLTGNDLLSLCKGSIAERSSCSGYIVGLSDQRTLLLARLSKDQYGCEIPRGVNSDQLVDVFWWVIPVFPLD
jgi:hypothetical protein